jgi:hypothetical protein
MAPLFWALALDGDEWSASCPGRFTPVKKLLVPTGYEAERASESIWKITKTRNILPHLEPNSGLRVRSQLM